MSLLANVTVERDAVSQVLRAIKRATRQDVLIGIPYNHTARPGDVGISNALIGHINEFGSPAQNIPERPHLIPGVLSVRTKVTDLMADGLISEMQGIDDAAVKSMHAAGITAVVAVKKLITSRLSPALAPYTLERREERGRTGTLPLIDTGAYLNALTYVVRTKGARDAVA